MNSIILDTSNRSPENTNIFKSSSFQNETFSISNSISLPTPPSTFPSCVNTSISHLQSLLSTLACSHPSLCTQIHNSLSSILSTIFKSDPLRAKYKKLKKAYKEKQLEVKILKQIGFTENPNKASQENNTEIEILKSKIIMLENEKEQTKIYSKELEIELERAHVMIKDNKVKMIEPLKAKLNELELKIKEKEENGRRSLRRKLRKCKKELENEK